MLRQLRSLKLVAAATAVFGLVSIASADMNFESSGAMKWRGEEFSDTLGNAGVVNSRSRDYMSMAINWDLKFMPDPKVMVFFQPKYVKMMGDDPAGSQGAATNGAGTVDSALDVHQGYLTYMHSDRVNYTIGRYEMKYGDEYVIGPVGWSMSGRAFEGIKVNYKWSKGWLDAFYNKLQDRDAGYTGLTADDFDFYGLYHSMSFGDVISAFDLYYLVKNNRTTQTDPGPTEERTTMGARIKGATGPVDFTAEVNQQSGEANAGTVKTDIEDAGSMRAEVGFTMNQNWRIAGEYAKSDRNYDQLYPTGHKWLGHMDLFGRRNITDMAVHVSGKFMEHMSLQAAYHMFSRSDDSADKNGAYASVYNMAGTPAAYSTAAAGDETDVGSEIDVNVTCNKLKALAWTLGVSQFTPGDYFTDTTKGMGYVDEVGAKMGSMSFVYLQATAKF